MANPLSLPYSLPPYRRVLLIAASFSVWHSSVRPSVRPSRDGISKVISFAPFIHSGGSGKPV